MKLVELVDQIQNSAKNPDGTKATVATILQYINEEMDYVCKRYPEKTKFQITTVDGYTQTISGGPNIVLVAVLLNGSPVKLVQWNDLRWRIGDAI